MPALPEDMILMAGDSFLGINKSAGKYWVDALSLTPLQRNRLVAALCESFPISLCRWRYFGRPRIGCRVTAQLYAAKITRFVAKPSRFKDLDKAAERLAMLVVEVEFLAFLVIMTSMGCGGCAFGYGDASAWRGL